MRYYIADTHFFHENMNHKYDMRGFADAQEMNSYMIAQWNSRVHKNDEVVILGDFSYGDAEQTNELLRKLNGRLYMIEGNHDYVLHDREFDTSRFIWIRQYAQMHDNGRRVILCHYPIMCYNGQYHVSSKGKNMTYMLHGHVHNTQDQKFVDAYVQSVRASMYYDKDGNPAGTRPCNMINCFCMYSDYVPLSLDEWILLEENRRRKSYEN
jgi:calcineurin-like phosphoesterase family protein